MLSNNKDYNTFLLNNSSYLQQKKLYTTRHSILQNQSLSLVCPETHYEMQMHIIIYIIQIMDGLACNFRFHSSSLTQKEFI